LSVFASCVCEIRLTALGIPPLASPALALTAPLPDEVVVLLVMVVGVDMVIIMVVVELEPVDEDAEPAIPDEVMLN